MFIKTYKSIFVYVFIISGLIAGNTLYNPISISSPPNNLAPQAQNSIRFAVIGDYGKAGQPELDVANLVNSWNPSFIITTGDNNYSDGSASTIDANIGQYYHDFIYPYTGSYGAGATTNRFFPSLGNHDWHATNAQPYLNYFSLPNNERYYNYVRGPVQFFVVDSDSHEPDGISSTSTQGKWIKNRIEASTSTWKIVYMHHPPYSSGSNHGSTSALQWPYASWGADAVLAGHDHIYERISRNGIVYFVNGLGGHSSKYSFGSPVTGSQVRYNGDYGAMLVDASESQITFQFINRSGVVIDSYTLHNSSPTNTPTSSATFTPTMTPTSTNTATFTPTQTFTQTPTDTPTATPTDTSTPTNTAEVTDTPTASDTPTFTPTDTPTATDTIATTDTPTQTNTPTNTPTFTSTNTPTGIDFGDQLFRTSNPPEIFTITNIHAFDITLGTLQGSNSVGTTWVSSKSFFIENDACSGAVLSSGESCTFNVKFLPWQLGTKTGTITIPSNAPDAPYVLSLSGNSIAGSQLLFNRSFENFDPITKIPKLWSATPTFKTGLDGIDSTWAAHGTYSVKLVGDGDLKVLSQQVDKPGVAGDDFSFFVVTHGNNIPVDSSRWLLQIMFYNGSTIVENRNVNLQTGTYDYKLINRTYTAANDYTHIIFRIHFGKSSGTAWVDLASLQWAP